MPSCSTTSASCGPANPVLRNTMSVPSLAAATTSITNPRWLRARIPTVLVVATPRRRRPRAIPSVAVHSSPNVSVPRSSITAGAAG